MIRTTSAQITDAQNQISNIIYFDMGPAIHNREKSLRSFVITSYIVVDNTSGSVDGLKQINVSDGQGGSNTIYLKAIRENVAIFKEATFLTIWGNLTLTAFEAQVPSIMIQQISYINTYTWTGDEAQPPVRFWNLASDDMEVVNLVNT